MRWQKHTYPYKGLERSFLYVNGSQQTDPTAPEVNALVVSLHGLSQSAETALKSISKLGRMGFHLIAPQGYKASWNADSCCGEAKTMALDDEGFLDELVRFIKQEWFASKPNLRVYLTGFSNGAFMASKLALYTLAKGSREETWIDYLALFSGYSYNITQYDLAAKSPSVGRFPVFYTHALYDTYVNPSGCCGAVTTGCCCEISSGSTCVSIRDVERKWMRINQCDPGAKVVPEDRVYPFPMEAICHRARGCGNKASVVGCDVPNDQHFYPYEDVLFQLFADDYLKAMRASSSKIPTLETMVDNDANDASPMNPNRIGGGGMAGLGGASSSPMGTIGLLLALTFIAGMLAMVVIQRVREYQRMVREEEDHRQMLRRGGVRASRSSNLSYELVPFRRHESAQSLGDPRPNTSSTYVPPSPRTFQMSAMRSYDDDLSGDEEEVVLQQEFDDDDDAFLVRHGAIRQSSSGTRLHSPIAEEAAEGLVEEDDDDDEYLHGKDDQHQRGRH